MQALTSFVSSGQPANADAQFLAAQLWQPAQTDGSSDAAQQCKQPLEQQSHSEEQERSDSAHIGWLSLLCPVQLRHNRRMALPVSGCCSATACDII